MNKGRSGSFTQFIFRYDLCSCGSAAKPGSTAFVDAVENSTFAAPADEPFEEMEPDESVADVTAELFPIDRYTPLKRIGMGAVGVVYLCHDVNLNKRVVLKTLHYRDAEQLVAFQKEARVLSKLAHPNIVRILDFGATSSGSPYMVLEHSKGITLDIELQENGPLSPDGARNVFSQLVKALAYCHDHAVMHRDLKPENILLCPSKRDDSIFVKLIDFGIAMVEDQESTSINGRTITGTPAYMPPDQVRGYAYDTRSEVYSLGCVLFEALTGRPPFIGATALDVLNKHANDEPPSVNDWAPQAIPEDLERIIEKCLQKRPSDRYQNMQELGADLGLEDKPVIAEDVNESTRTASKVSKTRIGVLVAAIALLGGGAALYFSQRAPEAVPQKKKNNKALKKSNGAVQDRSTFVPRGIDPNILDYKVEKPFNNEYLLSGTINRAALSDFVLKYQPRIITLLGPPMAEISWDALSELKPLTNLYELDLTDTRFSDADIPHLANLPPIQKLSLRGTTITDDGIKKLIKLKSLQNLEMLLLGNTKTSATYFPDLKKLPRLRGIDVENTSSLTLADLTLLTTMPRMSTLEVSSMPIGDEGVKILSRLSLDSIELQDCDVSDKCVDYLVNQKKLRKLSLTNNAKITDKCIPGLAKLPSLIVFRYGMDTRFTKDGLATLQRARPRLVLKEDVGWGKKAGHKEALTDAASELDIAGP